MNHKLSYTACSINVQQCSGGLLRGSSHALHMHCPEDPLYALSLHKKAFFKGLCFLNICLCPLDTKQCCFLSSFKQFVFVNTTDFITHQCAFNFRDFYRLCFPWMFLLVRSGQAFIFILLVLLCMSVFNGAPVSV